MADLKRTPMGAHGLVHAITPASAGWTHVGFSLYRLHPGETAAEATGEREAMLVLVEGKAEIDADGEALGELGSRMDVFSGERPYAVYVPAGASWSARATTPLTLAVCTAPGKAAGKAASEAAGEGARPVTVIRPDEIEAVTRGRGTNTRRIHPIAMEERDVADSLLVTEVFTPQGHWSSYPPHRHDEDDYPRMTHLEETYYHRLNPATGFGVQRVFTEDGSLDETMAVSDGDVVLVPKGHHPCGAPYGVEMYYLNVMAGPRRAWRFANHPDFDWIAQRDAG